MPKWFDGSFYNQFHPNNFVLLIKNRISKIDNAQEKMCQKNKLKAPAMCYPQMRISVREKSSFG